MVCGLSSLLPAAFRSPAPMLLLLLLHLCRTASATAAAEDVACLGLAGGPAGASHLLVLEQRLLNGGWYLSPCVGAQPPSPPAASHLGCAAADGGALCGAPQALRGTTHTFTTSVHAPVPTRSRPCCTGATLGSLRKDALGGTRGKVFTHWGLSHH